MSVLFVFSCIVFACLYAGTSAVSWTSFFANEEGLLMSTTVKEGILMSSDEGKNWVRSTAPVMPWNALSMSADGKILAATASKHGLYMSNDFGNKWKKADTNANSGVWKSVKMSSSGQYMFACTEEGVYRSTDFGESWEKSLNVAGNWHAISMSENGQYGSVVGLGEGIYVTSDYGKTWVSSSVEGGSWVDVASDESGQYLTVVGLGEGIYASSDYGVSWTKSNAPELMWQSISSSKNFQVAAAKGDRIYVSQDFGKSWSMTSSPKKDWTDVVINQDGQFYGFTVGDEFVYSSRIANRKSGPFQQHPMELKSLQSAFAEDSLSKFSLRSVPKVKVAANSPTNQPSSQPTAAPTTAGNPTFAPSHAPTETPITSAMPTAAPTETTEAPTTTPVPSEAPTAAVPTTAVPTVTAAPTTTEAPTTAAPTATAAPTTTAAPSTSTSPTMAPTTVAPTFMPTTTKRPTASPAASAAPTFQATSQVAPVVTIDAFYTLNGVTNTTLSVADQQTIVETVYETSSPTPTSVTFTGYTVSTRRRLTSVGTLATTYTIIVTTDILYNLINFPNYTTTSIINAATSSINASITSGQFTIVLQTNANNNGNPALSNAAANQVTFTSTVSNPPSGSDDEGLSDGEIAAIVICSAFGFFVIVALVYFFVIGGRENRSKVVNVQHSGQNNQNNQLLAGGNPNTEVNL